MSNYLFNQNILSLGLKKFYDFIEECPSKFLSSCFKYLMLLVHCYIYSTIYETV